MRFLAVIFVLGLVQFSFGQDIIFMKSGIKIECKVEEVGKMKIHFVRFDNDFSESKMKRDVLVVQYGNGEYYYPNLSEEVVQRNEMISKVRGFAGENGIAGYPKNKVFFNVNNILFGNLNFGYERISKSGKLGIRFPFKMGFGNENYSYIIASNDPQTVVYSGGVEFLYYLIGNDKTTYVSGVGVELGRSNFFGYANNGLTRTTYTKDYLGVLFYNGVAIQIIEELEFLILGGIGPKSFINRKDRTGVIANFSFNVAYKF